MTAKEVRKLRPGTRITMAVDVSPGDRIEGTIVQYGHQKKFRSDGGNLYTIMDRPGWHWVMEPGADSRRLPVDHAKSGRRK